MADRAPIVTTRQLSVAPRRELLQLWREAQLTQLAIGTPADMAAKHADETVRYYASLAEDLAVIDDVLEPKTG